MIKALWALGLVGALLTGPFACSDAPAPHLYLKAGSVHPASALDDYIAATDSSYRWRKVETSTHQGVRIDAIELISQTWQPPAAVDRPQWRHWLMVYTPAKLSTTTSLLYISGGKNGESHQKLPNKTLAAIAGRSGAITAELRTIPNQTLEFDNDGQSRKEDDLLAYTWARYLDSGDPRWPAQFPMVKSVVRAMDTLQALGKAEDFVLAGASKRGWTTWLSAAVDTRVAAIIPLVIDVLNLVPSMDNHYAAYGYWSPAIRDYVHHGIVEQRHHPNFGELMKLVDPYSYRARLELPKYIINAAGDEFFLPDSSRFYFDQLPGEKYLRYIPNTKHSLKRTDAFESLEAYFTTVIRKSPRPEFSWTVEQQVIRVTSRETPSRVKLWQATNPGARDFRLDSIGKVWTSRSLSADSDGRTYSATLAQPATGWSAFFVELTFDSITAGSDKNPPLIFTTPVTVLPETLPFALDSP